MTHHFYIRLVFGIVFVGFMIFSVVTGKLAFGMLSTALAAVYLCSVHSLWKKNRENRK